LISFVTKKFSYFKKTSILPQQITLMIHSNKRKVNLLLLLAACVFISIAATKPNAVSTSANETSQQDTIIFKNLKILPKNISKDSLDKIMHAFNKALGVKCNFCHAMKDGHPDFPSDDKPEKDVARYMLHMTAEINAKYFNMDNSTRPDTLSTVKCLTCHHGSPHPDEAAMPVNPQGNMPPPPPPPEGDSAHKMPPPPNQK